MTTANANRQIARAAGTVMFAILFSQLAGLVRGILVASAFPAAELDAFSAANRVSETLFTLIAAGALGSAFLPTFTSLLVKNDSSSAWKLASSLINLVTLILSIAALLASVFAPQIVRYLLAPGLSSKPELFALTVTLLRIQSISAVLFGLGGLVISILNAHQIFFIPQITAAMYQIGQIFGVLVLARWLGIYGLAWGVVIGAGLFLLVQLPLLFRLKGEFSLSLGWSNPDVWKVIRLMGPRIFGAAVVQLNFWVNTNLGSRMAEGSLISISYGFMLMLMAQAAIAQSVAIAAMPTFSAQHALGKQDEMRASLASALRGVFMLALPASIGLMLLARPIVSMLYQRGQFNATVAEMTAWALLWYAAGLVGHSMMEVLTRAFYAQHDTKTPVIIGTIAMGLNVIFSFGFAWLFTQIGWMPHGGLALANSLATALEATALFVFMRRRLNGIAGSYIARGFLACTLAALAMGVGLWTWMRLTENLTSWLIALGGVIIGGIIYATGIILLRVPEIQIVIGSIKRRILPARP
ncbi:MAG TPA: murein biosynthesis integral membrane protein MurJ [Anaerolineales bacterium]|nr:murein biosynthesis integral membrane protein MurJ [Anaerolineales bacterium]